MSKPARMWNYGQNGANACLGLLTGRRHAQMHVLLVALGAGCTCEAEAKVHWGAASEREDSAGARIWETDVGNRASEVRVQAGGYWQLVRAVVRYVRLHTAASHQCHLLEVSHGTVTVLVVGLGLPRKDHVHVTVGLRSSTQRACLARGGAQRRCTAAGEMAAHTA